jgi:hypothetical protein
LTSWGNGSEGWSLLREWKTNGKITDHTGYASVIVEKKKLLKATTFVTVQREVADALMTRNEDNQLKHTDNRTAKDCMLFGAV